MLKAEGFAYTFLWHDGANAFYPDHTHTAPTAHIILEEELTRTIYSKPAHFARCSAATFQRALHIRRMWDRTVAGILLEKRKPRWGEDQVFPAMARSRSSTT